MGPVDYSEIADRYEANEIRHQIPVDALLAAWDGGPPALLDLACGTGLYLEAQTRALGVAAARWHGVDASPAMLAVARRKEQPWNLREGRAEALPFDATERFDYVVCRFAFHHFGDKEAALDEIQRVLKPGGAVRFENIMPEASPEFWIYRYFPSTVAADEARFWSLTRLADALRSRGFTCQPQSRSIGALPARALLAEARNRETSQLHLITEAEYTEGLALLERDWAAEPLQLVDSGLTIGGLVAWRS